VALEHRIPRPRNYDPLIQNPDMNPVIQEGRKGVFNYSTAPWLSSESENRPLVDPWEMLHVMT